MKLKVVEVSHVEPKKHANAPDIAYVRTRIVVEVDGEHLSVENRMSPQMAKDVPIEFIMGKLRRQIMGAIEQRLFGDYNRRDY